MVNSNLTTNGNSPVVGVRPLYMPSNVRTVLCQRKHDRWRTTLDIRVIPQSLDVAFIASLDVCERHITHNTNDRTIDN